MGANVGARIDRTNERLDALATATADGFAQMNQRIDQTNQRLDQTNNRLDALIENTGAHWRDLDRRVTALEAERRS